MSLCLSFFAADAHAAPRRCENLFKVSSKVRASSDEEARLVTQGISGGWWLQVDGHNVFYTHIPAKRGRPTALVFTGLSTPVKTFSPFTAGFHERSKGEGLILFFYSTSIDALGIAAQTAAMRPDVPDLLPSALEAASKATLDDFANQAKAVLEHARVKGPVYTINYSYGSAPGVRFVEKYPALVKEQIFLSSLVTTGDHDASALFGQQMLNLWATVNPIVGRINREGMRDYTANQMATRFLTYDYPKGDYPGGISQSAAVMGMSRQIRTVDDFDLRNELKKNFPRTHFVIAEKERPYALKMQFGVVEKLKETQPQSVGDVVLIEGGAHQILESSPDQVVEVILNIMRGQPNEPFQ